MNTKAKICGIRTIEAALGCVKFGADFLGFNFVSTSRRFIPPLKAREIIEELPKEIKIVGVFQNESMEEIKKAVGLLRLDFVQLHGREGREYSSLTQYAGVIKAFSLGSDFDSTKLLEEMETYNVDYFLLDRNVQGEGVQLNLQRVKEVTVHYPIFLAGGLTSKNIDIIAHVAQPYAVDIAGGVETYGETDLDKVKEVIGRIKHE
ncbi:phosphoribosylanthranilate isomerase [Candidatus Gottesmanbacteria bacterium]|nr:phosphoribosylanthranilate isomerase [Candidatus Gottesmanbacteria bacterium]